MTIGEFDKPLEIGPRREMSPILQALLTALNLFFAQTLLAQPHGCDPALSSAAKILQTSCCTPTLPLVWWLMNISEYIISLLNNSNPSFTRFICLLLTERLLLRSFPSSWRFLHGHSGPLDVLLLRSQTTTGSRRMITYNAAEEHMLFVSLCTWLAAADSLYCAERSQTSPSKTGRW